MGVVVVVEVVCRKFFVLELRTLKFKFRLLTDVP